MFVDALAICKDEQNISLVLLFLLAAQSQTKCTIFEDFSLVFRRGKRRCTNFVKSKSEGMKKEEAGLCLLPLKRAYFRLNYLPKYRFSIPSSALP